MKAAEQELRVIRYLLIIIALPIVAIILKSLRELFIPLVIAIFLSFLFAPLIDWLKRKKVPIAVVILIVITVLILFFIMLSSLLYSAGNSLVEGLPRYQEKFTVLVTQLVDWLENWGEKMDLAFGSFPALDLQKMLTPGSFSLTKLASDTMGGFISLIWNIFLTLIFLLFIISGATSLEAKLKNAVGEDRQQRNVATVTSIQAQIQKYLMTKTIISVITGIIGGILMLIFGVDFVLVGAILLFALNYIPNIGSIIASGIPMLVCLLQYGFGFRMIAFSVLIIATQLLLGNILEPKLQGDRLDLSPIMVLVSLIVWGWLWGIPGMFISVPLTSAINIILKEVDNKNIISAIISGS